MSASRRGLFATACVAVLLAVASGRARADAPEAEVPPGALTGFAYLRLGYEGRPAAPGLGGPGFALGGRFELGPVGADLSVLDLTADGEAAGEGFSGAVFRVLGLWLVTPARARSLYCGVGLELIGSKGLLGPGDRLYTGQGSHAVATVGYELRRARTFRLFGQLEGLVPLYALETVQGERDRHLHLYLMLAIGL